MPPVLARSDGVNCTKSQLQKILNTKSAGGCGVARFP
nr:MAG TPA: hypothetical protein [Caudoviricetes sp.]